MTKDTFFEEARRRVREFDAWVGALSVPAVADHICYKCASTEEFHAMRALFEGGSAYIYQSIISGRRIAIVKFLEPLPSALGDIWFLELSDQKPDGSQVSGFDHVEVFPKQGSVEVFVEGLEAQGVVGEKVVRPHHTTFDVPIEGGLKVRVEPEALVEKIKMSEM